MSYLSDEIERQLKASGQSVDDLVAKTKLTRSQLYLWKGGEQTSINADQLELLAPALSSDLADHAALLRAHLSDEKFGPGSDLVRIEIDHPAVLLDRPRPRSKGERAIAFLAEERITNRDLNDLLIDLAKCLGADLEADASANSPGKAFAADIVSAALAEAKQAPSAVQPPSYKTPRRLKKATPPKSSST